MLHTPVLKFTNTLDILGRDLKAFIGDSSGDFFEVKFLLFWLAGHWPNLADS